MVSLRGNKWALWVRLKISEMISKKWEFMGFLQESEQIWLLSGSCVRNRMRGRKTPRQLRETPSVVGAVETERSD